jgi:carbon-monoxide dehydrogenase small subunit
MKHDTKHVEFDEIKLNINGRPYRLREGRDYEMDETLAEVLRERLGFTGVRVSCKEGACGACTVLLNGKSILSCLTLAVQADGQDVTTIEAFDSGDAVARAFAEESGPGYGTAMQCGFCTPGYVLETKSLLAESPDPTPERIRDGLSGHICRCGCYKGIEHAAERAARLSAEEGGAAK